MDDVERLTNLTETVLIELESSALAIRRELSKCRKIYDLPKQDVVENIKIPVSVKLNNGALQATVPAVLPHRHKKSMFLYTESLSEALANIKDTKDFKDFDDALNKKDFIVVFELGCAATHLVRDADNTECKQYVDIICDFLGIADQGVSFFKTSKKDLVGETKILVFNRADFIAYLRS